MRLITILITFVLLGIVHSQASTQTISKKYIRYSEKVRNGVFPFQNQGNKKNLWRWAI